MKFWEAMKALEEGKKVRGKSWDQDLWADSDSTRIYFTFSSASKEEWEIYAEPEKMYSFMEAIEGMGKRKKFRRYSLWNEDEYITQRGGILIKETCWRYKARTSEWQSYFVEPYKDGKCDEYLKMSECKADLHANVEQSE